MKRSETASMRNGANSKTNGKHGHTDNGSVHAGDDGGKEGFVANLWNRTLAPILLILVTPNVVILMWYTATKCDGSFATLVDKLSSTGGLVGLLQIWKSVPVGSQLSCAIVGGYFMWALLLMLVLPGPRAEGTLTPNGNIPVYKDNGFKCYIVTLMTFAALTVALKQRNMSPTIVYDHFDELLATTNVATLLFCLLLYLKGIYLPSTTDCGSSGNFIFDYYWGTELYPRVLGVDVKVFTNCRFGMTIWPLLVLIFTMKSYELHGFVDSIWVSSALQMAYFTKFFWWESGYMRTIDIIMDRAGYYICWGCLVFIAGFYGSVSLYLVSHPVHLGIPASLTILATGLSAIAVNYLSDLQKQAVRASNGQCTIWGRKPELIHASYRLEDGTVKSNLLLTSGYWGLARHFQYTSEITLALCWSIPALVENVMPYCYVIFLTVLLIHRTYRDDAKCQNKYGKYWDQYRRKVPCRMIPYIY